jgi:hypothetical protein
VIIREPVMAIWTLSPPRVPAERFKIACKRACSFASCASASAACLAAASATCRPLMQEYLLHDHPVRVLADHLAVATRVEVTTLHILKCVLENIGQRFHYDLPLPKWLKRKSGRSELFRGFCARLGGFLPFVPALLGVDEL